MNLSFQPSSPVAQREEVILVASVPVGKVRKYLRDGGETRYHASIPVPECCGVLMQGFGSTKREAVCDAIADGRKSGQKLLALADTLSRDIGE